MPKYANERLKEVYWTEDMIREELTRLDRITGLKGSSLRILFNNSKGRLACYSILKGLPGEFIFSDFYFKSDNFPAEEALDTIRHEYAHYMDRVLYGGTGHSNTWKKCCSDVGAVAMRTYSGKLNEYYISKNGREAELSKKCEVYKIGTMLKHPSFGIGKVIATEGESANKCLEVDFEKVGIKKIISTWALVNCKIIND